MKVDLVVIIYILLWRSIIWIKNDFGHLEHNCIIQTGPTSEQNTEYLKKKSTPKGRINPKKTMKKLMHS